MNPLHWHLKVLVLVLVSVTTSVLNAEELRFTIKRLAIDTNECAAVADYNRDGRPDISAGRNWYPAPDFTPHPVRAIGEFGRDYSENNGEHAYDVNGDGWPDIVAGSFMPTPVHWYENPGEEGLRFGKQWKAHLLADTKLSSNEMTWLLDMDGDGIPEFIVNSWHAENPMVYWKFARDSEGKAFLERQTIGQKGNGHGMGFGDVNGDGLEDIIFQDGWYQRPAGNPAEAQWTLHPVWMKKAASCPMLVVDLNRDGRNDIIWGKGHDFGLYWEEQIAPVENKTQWKQHTIDTSFSQPHALLWADLDNDGENELITGKRVRAHSGSDPGASEPPGLYYYDWQASSNTFERHVIEEGNVGTGLQLRVADFNGDGRLDILAPGKSGTYLVFNEGDGSQSEYTPLFNGKDLEGWRPFRKAKWSVADNVVVGEHSEGHKGGWLFTKKTYGDFDLRFSFRVTAGANSGIAFRYQGKGGPAKNGFEMQIGDADARCYTGGVFGVQQVPPGLLRAGQWQTGRVVAKGSQITSFIDGQRACTVVSDRAASGNLGIQVHGGKQYEGIRVEFKDMRVREF